jgi:hypothetical protein
VGQLRTGGSRLSFPPERDRAHPAGMARPVSYIVKNYTPMRTYFEKQLAAEPAAEGSSGAREETVEVSA